MTRQLSTKKYAMAFILTVLIFIAGIGVGMLFEEVRLNQAQRDIINEKANLQSLQLQQKYIESGTGDCAALNRILEANINDLTEKMLAVIDYQQRSVFNQEQFDAQLRDYFLTELQFMLISEDIASKCEKDSVTVVYFYDENEQSTQGFILDYIKKVFGSKVFIFSFDSSFQEEPLIPALLTSYNITTFPSVVIEDQVFQGETAAPKLVDAICKEFTKIGGQMPQKCEQ